MADLAQAVMTREATLWTQRLLFDTDYQEIKDLMHPGANDITTRRSPGQSRMTKMFDSTAMLANQFLQAQLMTSATNQNTEWHRLAFPEGLLQNDQEAQGWLSQTNRHLLQRYNTSNFYQQMAMFYLNYAAFGVAALWVLDAVEAARPGFAAPLRFRTVPHGTYVLADDADGRATTFMQRLQLTPQQAVQRWGANVSTLTRERASNPQNMDTRYDYLQAIFPREDWDPDSDDNRKFRYANVIIEKEPEHVVEHSGFRTMPVVVARWSPLADAAYGFGPGHMALPDTRTLNRLKEMQLEMLELQVQPALKQRHEGVLGRIALKPLHINVVREMDDLSTIDINGRPDLVQISQADLRQAVNDIFHVNALSAIPEPDAPVRTAFEISERIAEKARLMGPAFLRLTTEAFNVMIDRVFQLEWDKGLIMAPPPQVFEALAGRSMDVEYLGPLARHQRSSNFLAIQSVYQVGAEIAAATQRPAVFDVLDDDVAIRRAADAVDVPPEMVRDLLRVQAMREARAEAQRRQQAGEQISQGAAALRDVTPFLETMGMGQTVPETRAA